MTQKCAACGNDLPADAKQCPTCGTPVAAPQTSASPVQPTMPSTETPVNNGATPGFGGQLGYVSQPMQDSNHRPRPGKKKLAVIAIIAVLLVGGILFAVLSKHSGSNDSAKSPATMEGRKTGDSREKRPASNGTTACYSVTLPAGSSANDMGDCSISINASDNERPISIRSFSSAGSLQEQTDKWKKSLVSSKGALVGQTAVKLGGYDAIKYTYHRNATSSNVYVSWFVYTGTKYQKNVTGPSGFEIRSSYNDAAQQKTADDLVASLKWK